MTQKHRPATPWRTVASIAVILAAAGVTYGIYAVGARVFHRRGVRAAIPKYREGLKEQREDLSRAIEKYHDQFGFYPPNRAAHRTEHGVVNPLYYELAGTRWNTNYQTFGLPTTKETIKPETMLSLFGMSSFSNSLTYPASPTNFLEGLRFFGRGNDGAILVGSPTPDGVAEEYADDFAPSAWRYTADPAEHNPGKFDLWIEVDVLDEHFVINNWAGGQ